MNKNPNEELPEERLVRLERLVEKLGGEVKALEMCLKLVIMHLPKDEPSLAHCLIEEGDAGWLDIDAISPEKFAALKFMLYQLVGGQSPLVLPPRD